MRRSFLLIRNATAGRTGRPLVDQVISELRRAGASVVEDGGAEPSGMPIPPDYAKQFDAAIAAGGDGTMRAAAIRLMETDLPLGIIPQGTGNVLAHEIQLPKSPKALAHVLMSGPARKIDGARINGEPFFLMAGIGFDAELVKRLDYASKRTFGKAAYTRPVLKVLMGMALPVLNVEIDGVKKTASWVIAANGERYGGWFRLTGKAGLGKDGLAFVLVKSQTRASLLSALAALPLGRFDRHRDVEIIEGRRASVTCDRSVSVQADGDLLAVTTPVEIEWGGPTVSLILPGETR